MAARAGGRQLAVLLVIAGALLVAYGAWNLVPSVAPRSRSAGTVTSLHHVLGTGKGATERHEVHVRWDGGTGSIDDASLYAALDPLQGAPRVEVERARLTGVVTRVALGGRWYAAPSASPWLGLGDLAAGIACLLVALVAARRPGTWRRARARLGPLAGRRIVAAVLGVASLAFLVGGAYRLVALTGPVDVVHGRAVAADGSYVDLTWPGGGARVVDADLELAASVRLDVAAAFDDHAGVPVVVRRSALDGTVRDVEMSDVRHDVAPSMIGGILAVMVGVFGLLALGHLLVRGFLRAPVVFVHRLSDGPTGPPAGPRGEPGA